MNDHLATYPTAKGVNALWTTNQVSPADEMAHEMHGIPLPKTRKLEMGFRRIVMGMCFDPMFVTVVAERWFEFEERSEAVFVILDEIIDTTVTSDVFKQMIELKDKYLVDHIFAPTQPGSFTETLRRTDGLTYYSEPKIEQVAGTRWPSFVNFDNVPRVTLRDIPSTETLTAELNDMLQSEAVDPKTQYAMRGNDGDAIPKLLFLDDMPMLRTLQSVRTGNMAGSLALWNAVKGMASSAVVLSVDQDEYMEQKGGNLITGY
jgi:hypothetical protein|tara:strand:- start:1351 stop:2133 length:783 start_codon:yes stop_codon:yes gene_type:complete